MYILYSPSTRTGAISIRARKRKVDRPQAFHTTENLGKNYVNGQFMQRWKKIVDSLSIFLEIIVRLFEEIEETEAEKSKLHAASPCLKELSLDLGVLC